MTFCITVFGTVSNTCSKKLFEIQKHYTRILFGDLEKYLDKFKKSARTRPFETQRLGAEFFCPGQYCKNNVVYLGEKLSGFYQPKGDFSSL